jgi:sulfonate transport system substrate-binding protein
VIANEMRGVSLMLPTKPRSARRDRNGLARCAGLLLLAVLPVAAAACSTASAHTASGKSLVKLVIGAPATAVVGLSPELSGPAGWAIQQGKADAILARYGYTYGGFAGFVNGPPAAQALASGSIQVAVIGDAPAILARSAGEPNRAILMSEEFGGIWIAARNGGPTSIAQLKGEKVGVQLGSIFDHYLRYVLAQDGLTGQVTLVNLAMGDGYAALTSGAIDAYSAEAGIAAVWQQKGGVKIINKAEVAYPHFASDDVALVTQSFLKEHPNIQQAWWALYNEGQTLIRQNPTAYLTWTAKESGETLAIAKATSVLTFQNTPITAGAIAAATSTQQFLLQQKLAQSDFSIGGWAVDPPASGS